jgi:hypothetical protein
MTKLTGLDCYYCKLDGRPPGETGDRRRDRRGG